MKYQPTGVYLLTNDEPFHSLFTKLETLCDHEENNSPAIELLQYRRKHISTKEQHTELAQLKPFCDERGIQLIINDSIELAKMYQAGVHLGQDDGSIENARSLLGDQAIIGRTCHQSLNLAMQAERSGANYVAFGVYRPSKTKPNAHTLPATLLSQATQMLTVPICVIGGVEIDDFQTLSQQGVRYFAVINGLLAGNTQEFEHKSTQLRAWQKSRH